MLLTVLADLRSHSTWDPQSLTKPVFQWPSEAMSTEPLRSIATPLLATGWVREGIPVITPTGLDRIHGGIRRRSSRQAGQVFEIREQGEGVVPGDLLLPLDPELPALMIAREHAGSVASASFLALRAGDLGLWLWAVLNSTSGHASRSASTHSSLKPSRSALLDLPVPVPPPAWVNVVHQELTKLERDSRARPEDEAVETWWRLADLTPSSWALDLATPDPAGLDGGIPLGQLVSSIVGGRASSPMAYVEGVMPGLLPLVEAKAMSQGRVRRWVSPDGGAVVAGPGDIVVAEIGPRSHAQLIEVPSVVGANVYRITLVEPSMGPALVRYLNGQAGYGVRQSFMTGSTIPRLTKRGLEQLPVRLDADEEPEAGSPSSEPLAERLERLLWM